MYRAWHQFFLKCTRFIQHIVDCRPRFHLSSSSLSIFVLIIFSLSLFHPSLSLLHSVFDAPHIRYFMCTCVYPSVADQLISSYPTSAGRGKHVCGYDSWLLITLQLLICISCLPRLFSPWEVKSCQNKLRKSFHAVPAVSVNIVNLDKLFSEAEHSGEFSSPLSWKEENYIITRY